MSLVLELITEILSDLYVELMLLVVPKRITKGRRTVAKLLVAAELILLLVAVVAGILLIVEGGSLAGGIVLLTAVVALSVWQIVFGLRRRLRERKRNE